MKEILLNNVDFIFFVYGFSFFWLALLLMPFVHSTDPEMRGGWGWLSLFCFFHGTNEWMDMIALLMGSGIVFSAIRFIVMAASFLFLFEFGRVALPAKGRIILGRWIYLLLFALIAVGFSAGLTGLNAATRYVLALPGGVLATRALLKHPGSSIPLKVAAMAMFCYSLAAGLVVPNAGFFPTTLVNGDSFLALCGVPIQFLRAVLALVMAFAIGEQFLRLHKGRHKAEQSPWGRHGRQWLGLALATLLFGGFYLVSLGGRFGRHFDEVSSYVSMSHVHDSLTSVLDQGKMLSALLATAPETRIGITARPSKSMESVNALLDKFATILPGSSVAYLLDRDGMTIASSNRDRPDSFIGKSYAVRPYFKSAREGRPYTYLATGLTSKLPGCYFGHPITAEDGTFVGAAVIKVALNKLDSFAEENMPTFLISPEGIVLISSIPSLMQRPMWPLNEEDLATAKVSRQFPSFDPRPIFPARFVPDALLDFGGQPVSVVQGQVSVAGWSLIQFFTVRSEPWFRLITIVCCLLVGLLISAYCYNYLRENQGRSAIQESAAQYRAMFEKNLAIMYMLDPRTNALVEINDSAAVFYGYSPEECGSLKITDISCIPNPSLTSHTAEILRAGGHHFESLHRLKSGELRDVEVYASPVQLQRAPIIYAIVHDITERKRAEREKATIQAQLVHSEKLASIGTLAAGVAHEINNPLAIVRGYTGLLAKRLMGASDARTLKVINNAINRIVAIVDSLGNYARVDNDLLGAVDIHKTIEEVLLFVGQLSKSAGVEIVQKCASSTLYARANTGKMQQVLINLLTNACDALQSREAERRIVIETRAEQQSVKILISDNGDGIPASILNKIFDPFFTTKPVGKGTGLGLSISHSIIKSFDGSLCVSSRTGEGAVFEITLQCMDRQATSHDDTSKAPQIAANSPLRGEVLVVDDEPGLCMLLEDQLSELGLSITVSADPIAALTMMETKRFDLIITDMQMPAISGISLVRRARGNELQTGVKIIVLTGGTATDFNEEDSAFLSTNVQGFMTKPWDQEQFLTLVASLLSPTDINKSAA